MLQLKRSHEICAKIIKLKDRQSLGLFRSITATSELAFDSTLYSLGRI